MMSESICEMEAPETPLSSMVKWWRYDDAGQQKGIYSLTWTLNHNAGPQWQNLTFVRGEERGRLIENCIMNPVSNLSPWYKVEGLTPRLLGLPVVNFEVNDVEITGMTCEKNMKPKYQTLIHQGQTRLKIVWQHLIVSWNKHFKNLAICTTVFWRNKLCRFQHHSCFYQTCSNIIFMLQVLLRSAGFRGHEDSYGMV